MQISTKFTIAIHILTAVTYFSKDRKVTSDFLSQSAGSNPVIIRNIMSQLRKAGLIEIKRGSGGITIMRPLDQITYLDIYLAVEKKSEEQLFKFHAHPNPNCPVGGTIHQSLDDSLLDVQTHFEAELATHTVADVYKKTIRAVGAQEKT